MIIIIIISWKSRIVPNVLKLWICNMYQRQYANSKWFNNFYFVYFMPNLTASSKKYWPRSKNFEFVFLQIFWGWSKMTFYLINWHIWTNTYLTILISSNIVFKLTNSKFMLHLLKFDVLLLTKIAQKQSGFSNTFHNFEMVQKY